MAYLYSPQSLNDFQSSVIANDSDTLLREIQKEQIKLEADEMRNQSQMNIQIQEAREKADIEVGKTYALESIRTDARIEREKRKADIQSCRELQKTNIVISKDGRLIICREQFGEDKKEAIDFRLAEGSCILNCEEKGEKVLRAFFCSNCGQERELLLPLSQADERTIERKFTALGIGFGFSRKKNRELLVKLIQVLVSSLPSAELPLKCGWRKRGNGKWEYISPEILTWEDITNAY